MQHNTNTVTQSVIDYFNISNVCMNRVGNSQSCKRVMMMMSLLLPPCPCRRGRCCCCCCCWPSASQLFLGCRGLPGVQGLDWWTSHSVAISMYTFEICGRGWYNSKERWSVPISHPYILFLYQHSFARNFRLQFSEGLRTSTFGEGEAVGGRGWYRSKERW